MTQRSNHRHTSSMHRIVAIGTPTYGLGMQKPEHFVFSRNSGIPYGYFRPRTRWAGAVKLGLALGMLAVFAAIMVQS